jgi:crossover junction endodeoxyribonuclease RuvC
VSPAVWKKHFKLPADKEASRALALPLFPATAEHFARKKDHGRAEAALIARYGSEVLGLLGQSDRSALVAEKSATAIEGGAP